MDLVPYEQENILVKISGLIIGLLVVFLYTQTIFGGFIYDDTYYIRDNPAIRSHQNLPKFFTDPSTGVAHTEQSRMIYRPLATTFFAAEHAFFGLEKPGRYHIVSILLFLFLIGTLSALSLLLFNGDLRPALLATALIALHPLSTETVSWISAQPTLLCSLLIVFGILFHRFSRLGSLGSKKMFRVLSVGCFCSAVFVKEMGVTGPFLLLAADRLFETKKEKSSFPSAFQITLVTVGCYLIIRSLLLGRISQTALYSSSWPAHIAAVVSVIPRYLIRVVFPVDLHVFYNAPDPNILSVFAGVAFLFGLPLVAFRLRKTHPVASFGLLMCVLTFLPSSNILPTGMPTSERYFFLPLIGLSFVVADLVRPWLRGPRSEIVVCILLVVAFIFSFLTFERTRVWSSGVRFWEQAVADQPNLPMVYYNLGIAAAAENDPVKAEKSYLTAITLSPGYSQALNNLGSLLARQKRYDEAEFYFKKALDCYASDSAAMENYLRVLVLQNKSEAALDYLLAESNSIPVHVLNRMAQILVKTPGFDEALLPRIRQFIGERDAVTPKQQP